MHDPLADLNSQQLRAVTHAAGPLLVIAGPGSGKTRVVTRRIVHRIRVGRVDARRIVALTFTNRAAAEMRQRVQELCDDVAQPQIGTFHWLCSLLLRRHGVPGLGDRSFRLLTPSESRAALSRSAMAHRVAPGEIPRYAEALSALKNGGALVPVARSRLLDPEALRHLAKLHADVMRRSNAVDLDDLLVFAVQLLRENESLQQRCRAGIHELMVDEYQDTNPRQRELLRLLTPVSETVVAVGDDDQAIYGWRQAVADSVKAFREDFPRCETVSLTTSYRHSKHVLRAASSLIRHNSTHHGKNLTSVLPAGPRPTCYVADDEWDEAEWTGQRIQELVTEHQLNYGQIAVLYRVNALSRAIEDSFVRHGVPYRVLGGSGFYDRPEVRRVAAYLRLMLNLEDVEAAVFLLSEVAGVGPRRLAALRDAAVRAGVPIISVAADPMSGVRLPAAVSNECRRLDSRIESLQELRAGSVPRAVDAVLQVVAPGSTVGSELDSAGENLNELRSMARESGATRGTLREFVDRIALHTEATSAGDRASLLTLHAAKGLEFAAVFMVGMEEGLLPHRRSLQSIAEVEEERRLCYVGMTRAMTYLHLSYAHSRLISGQAMVAEPSRFVREIGDQRLDLRVSKRTASKPRLLNVVPGERVDHARWGGGTVVETQGTARNTMVTIVFDRVGTQRLQLCHAPLVRLGSEANSAASG